MRSTRESVFAAPAELAAIVARVNAEEASASAADPIPRLDAESWRRSRYSLAAAEELDDLRREADLAQLRVDDLEVQLRELRRKHGLAMKELKLRDEQNQELCKALETAEEALCENRQRQEALCENSQHQALATTPSTATPALPLLSTLADWFASIPWCKHEELHRAQQWAHARAGSGSSLGKVSTGVRNGRAPKPPTRARGRQLAPPGPTSAKPASQRPATAELGSSQRKLAGLLQRHRTRIRQMQFGADEVRGNRAVLEVEASRGEAPVAADSAARGKLLAAFLAARVAAGHSISTAGRKAGRLEPSRPRNPSLGSAMLELGEREVLVDVGL